jgi:hypothetical protein
VTASGSAAQTIAVDFTHTASAAYAAAAGSNPAFSLVVTTSTGQAQTVIPVGVCHLRARAGS